ncbi:MAG: AAA family ATPase [Pseudomonadota bacterium]
MPLSSRLEQVIEVLRRVRAAEPTTPDAVAKARKTATKALASERHIDERTVADKCWRGLWASPKEDFHIGDFDGLIWRWLSGDGGPLQQRCLAAAVTPDDRIALESFFAGGEPMKRYRFLKECEAWPEEQGGQLTIVVNSMGGGSNRRPGMTVLFKGLAEAPIPISKVGYHATGKEFVPLEDMALGAAELLADPLKAVQAVHRAVGQIEGANQGSRLRIVLGDSTTMAELTALLERIADHEGGGRTGKEIVEHVHDSLQADGLDFSRDQVADFYLAVRTKPFVLLAGISGTGKSILARRFAEACGFPAHLIPVRPDWSDPSELLGYRDLEGAFVPGKLLPHLVAAIQEPAKPYFIILDEMNLARVEHYFADFLSILETRRRKGDQVITDPLGLDLDRETTFRCGEDLAHRLRTVLAGPGLSIPSNVCFIGTVNMDESTHPFSKKVLDRAMTLEFVEVNLLVVPERRPRPDPLPVGGADLDAPFLSLSEIYKGRESRFQDAIQLLVDLNTVLAKASLQVGYRTRDEICLYLHHNAEQGLLSQTAALDLAVYHKVLPRLQGGEEVRDLLGEVRQLLAARELPRCLRKIDEMKARLEQAGFTAFWS